MKQDLIKLANGKWRGIISACGISGEFLTGKHCACPICGGRDRFRFDDKNGEGTWICNQCGSGYGIGFLMKVLKIDFKDAIKRVDEVIGQVDYQKPRAEKTDAQLKLQLRQMWKQSRKVFESDFVDRYLSARGINLRPDCLRTIDTCRTSRGQYFPAMLALVSDKHGNPVTIHRTYLGESGKAEIESPREIMAGKLPEGIAIRLGKEQEEIGIAEGIETALAASQLHKMPVWAAINASMMEKWSPPESAKIIHIYGDSDANYTGEKSAYVLANRLSIKGNYKIKVHIPLTQGYDWNDVLKEMDT